MTLCLNRWLPGMACLVFSTAAPCLASGQTTSDQWPGLSTSNLPTVYLLDRSGAETSGKLVGLQGESLLLLVDGTERRIDRGDVVRIQKRDSLKNGTLIGAAIGMAMGFITAGISDCPGDDPGGTCGGFRAVTFASSVGIYAGMGAGVDALIRGRTTLYDAPPPVPARVSTAAVSHRGLIRVGFSW